MSTHVTKTTIGTWQWKCLVCDAGESHYKTFTLADQAFAQHLEKCEHFGPQQEHHADAVEHGDSWMARCTCGWNKQMLNVHQADRIATQHQKSKHERTSS